MAICCPRACGRLATAAAYLAIGIVQVIAGMILLRSKYVYLLSVPNFWTATANIAVGSLLGVSAAVWKDINKKNKHAVKRNLLAALACSAILLNGTTAGILIVDESNSLLSIHLESNSDKIYNSTTVANEILAYAYATSVCSPIVCIVISISFLTGIWFRAKDSTDKSQDFKNILRKDNTQVYNWVYTPKLPKSDPEALRTASESGISSSDCDSSSGSSTISAFNYSHTSINDGSTLQYETNNAYPSNISKTETSLYSNHSSNRMMVAGNPTLKKAFLLGVNLNKVRANSVNEGRYMPHSAVTKAKSYSSALRKPRTRGMPKILFTEYPSGDAIDGSILPSKENIPLKPTHHLMTRASQLVDNFSPVEFDPMNQNGLRMSVDSPSVYEDSVQYLSDSVVEIDQVQHHEKLRRTSTADYSKDNTEIQPLNDSEIPIDPVFISREISSKEESLRTNSLKNTSISDSFTPEIEQEMTADEKVSAELWKNSNLRLKLTSKLIPVSTPIVSNPSTVTLTQASDKTRPYTKSKRIYHNYIDYHRNGLSSFKIRKRVDEVDATHRKKRNSGSVKSPMESISELSVDESMLPSTSMHTSGYVSTLEESDNCSDSETSPNQKNQDPFPSPLPELVNDGFIPNSGKRTDSVSSLKMKHPSLDYRESLQENLQKVLQEFMNRNPEIRSEEVNKILQASTVF